MTWTMGPSINVSPGSDLKSPTSMYSIFYQLIFILTGRASCSTAVSRACASTWLCERMALSSAKSRSDIAFAVKEVCDRVPTHGLMVRPWVCLVYTHVSKCSQPAVETSMVPECLLAGLFMFSSLGGREWTKVLVASEGEVHNLCWTTTRAVHVYEQLMIITVALQDITVQGQKMTGARWSSNQDQTWSLC